MRRTHLLRLQFTLLLFSQMGCGSQKYELVPSEREADLTRSCNVVVAATAFDCRGYLQGMSLLPFGPSTDTESTQLRVDRVLKGKIKERMIQLTVVVGHRILFGEGKPYLVGYDSKFWCRYKGLKVLLVPDPPAR